MKKQKKLFLNERGFTLIELLASIIVLVAVGSVITGIITSSLRGTNKTNTIENLRQNGNYALNQISKDTTYTQPFDGTNTGFSNDNGVTYVTSCPFSSSQPPAPVTTTYSSVTVQSVSGIVTKYNCSGSVLTANGTDLVDTGSISLTNCSITCTQTKTTDTPIIKIGFTLGPKNQNGLAENSSSITFGTSVIMRNYQK